MVPPGFIVNRKLNSKYREWQVEGKKVVEVIIGRGEYKPYLAEDHEGRGSHISGREIRISRLTGFCLKYGKGRNPVIVTTVRFRERRKGFAFLS